MRLPLVVAATAALLLVATAVMQQVAAGRLSLDDTVEQWLPGLVGQGRPMTVRQLLSHRSGIHEAGASELPPLRTLTDRGIVRSVVVMLNSGDSLSTLDLIAEAVLCP